MLRCAASFVIAAYQKYASFLRICTPCLRTFYEGIKLWRLKYRFGGTEKLLAIGAYPQISLADARQKRDQAFVWVLNGADPSDTKKARKAAGAIETETFEVIAREWHTRFSSSWAASHGNKIIRRLELYVFPWLGNRPIKSITPPELLTVLRRIEAPSPDWVK